VILVDLSPFLTTSGILNLCTALRQHPELPFLMRDDTQSAVMLH